ncbi:adenine nucleotide alpha hydrolases-like protein [Acephala macrosclerotiorum]|nr:adenine nucleotide alpha hydrolases-like protein [Acephala macrosclerotiorum]
MAESLNVIALISGGKDSFFSLLHCIQNGHKVVALGNLYPPPISSKTETSDPPHRESEDEHDLNSFMYQTVGHTVIPLYEKALGIPIYRQPIVGTAVQTGTSYGHVPTVAPDSKGSRAEIPAPSDIDEDETESLVPLLKRIIAAHPEANALSTGAILSTYQRTRIESIAIRLDLIPLAYLWQYPILPPGTQSSLLQDMQEADLDARIVKVASGGLDESFLWQNVASEKVIRRVEKVMKRFGTDGDGAVLGEGGEFETLVVDGPGILFKGRIKVKEEDMKIVREGGGSAWLRIREASVIMKDEKEVQIRECRIPSLFEPRFQNILDELRPERTTQDLLANYTRGHCERRHQSEQQTDNSIFTIQHEEPDIEAATKSAIDRIRQYLHQSSLEPTSIVSTFIVLRSMSDFAIFNKIYSNLFTSPNPPSRVTIASGDITLSIHLLAQNSSPQKPPSREALHVQSRSYWAPANIGPYSQAISIPSSSSSHQTREVYIAGQIPLIPDTMVLPSPSPNPLSGFEMQAVLALQHLWRIGVEMKVRWFGSVVAYLPRSSSAEAVREQASIAAKAWISLHNREEGNSEEDEGDGERDLWEEKFFAGKEARGGFEYHYSLPDFKIIVGGEAQDLRKQYVPPFFAVEVEELPRGAGIEWHSHVGITNGLVRVSCPTSSKQVETDKI